MTFGHVTTIAASRCIASRAAEPLAAHCIREGQPARPWQGHRGGIGRTLPPGCVEVMLGSRLVTLSAHDSLMYPMQRCKLLVPVREEEVRLGREVDVPSKGGHPHQQPCRQHVDCETPPRLLE
jgi:hypothetical protein